MLTPRLQGTHKEGHFTFHATGEPPPVGKDHEGQLLPVEILDGLRCLVGRVWEPHLAGLLDYLEHRVAWVRFLCARAAPEHGTATHFTPEDRQSDLSWHQANSSSVTLRHVTLTLQPREVPVAH